MRAFWRFTAIIVLMLHVASCAVFETSPLEYIGNMGKVDESTRCPSGFTISPNEAKLQHSTRFGPRKTGYHLYHDGRNYYVLDGDRFHLSGAVALKEGRVISGRTGYFYDRETESWYSPYVDLDAYFTKRYHDAVPPGDLFVKVHQARYLGSPNGYSVLYYSFIWSGARESSHGTHKLIVFDEKERYLGTYYLPWPLDTETCHVKRTKLAIVFDEGRQVTLDFLHGPPKPSAQLMMKMYREDLANR